MNACLLGTDGNSEEMWLGSFLYCEFKVDVTE